MRTKLFNAIKVSLLALSLSLGLSFVYAWTAPTQNPPAGNVSAPINTSATAQTKAGGLTVGSLDAGSGAILTTGNVTGWNLFANSVTTNALKIPGAIAGQVLTATDAQGTVAWQAVGGGVVTVAKMLSSNNSVHTSPITNVCTSGSVSIPSGVTTVVFYASGGAGADATATVGGGGGGGAFARDTTSSSWLFYLGGGGGAGLSGIGGAGSTFGTGLYVGAGGVQGSLAKGGGGSSSVVSPKGGDGTWGGNGGSGPIWGGFIGGVGGIPGMPGQSGTGGTTSGTGSGGLNAGLSAQPIAWAKAGVAYAGGGGADGARGGGGGGGGYGGGGSSSNGTAGGNYIYGGGGAGSSYIDSTKMYSVGNGLVAVDGLAGHTILLAGGTGGAPLSGTQGTGGCGSVTMWW